VFGAWVEGVQGFPYSSALRRSANLRVDFRGPFLSTNLADQLPADPFHLFVDTVQDYAIFMLDPRGYVMTWNAGAQRIKGHALM